MYIHLRVQWVLALLTVLLIRLTGKGKRFLHALSCTQSAHQESWIRTIIILAYFHPHSSIRMWESSMFKGIQIAHTVSHFHKQRKKKENLWNSCYPYHICKQAKLYLQKKQNKILGGKKKPRKLCYCTVACTVLMFPVPASKQAKTRTTELVQIPDRKAFHLMCSCVEAVSLFLIVFPTPKKLLACNWVWNNIMYRFEIAKI